MTKKFSVVLAALAVIVTIAAPLSAQSIHLKATIPFEFTAGRATMPAGEYELLSKGQAEVLWIQNLETNASVVAVTNSADSGDPSRAGAPRLVFNRYGDHYVLAQIWDGSQIGREFTKTRSERELAKTASAKRIEILAMLMPR